MDIGVVGLGRMGLNIAIRLARGGHRVVVHNRSEEPVETAVSHGAERAESIADMAAQLEAPRVVWLMLPAGDVTDAHVTEALEALDEGDVLVEGGNTRWTDTLARAERARERGVHYVDAGVSGGVWGLENGYSIMFGGSEHAAETVTPVIQTLAPSPETGWGHVGPTGTGHFTKMVHNGIEYGMMQAFAEGFAILNAKNDWGTEASGDAIMADLDLGQIAHLWREGSVIQSWLLDLTAEALAERPDLKAVAPHVPDSGEGRWTVEAALDLRVPATTIAASLFARFASRDDTGFALRVLSAMRGQFGGHPVKGFPGADGEHGDEISDEGTIEIIPGGVRTEGAGTR